MRRFTACATALVLVWLGTLVTAQTKITTMEEYAKLMKSNAQTNGAMNKAIGSGAFADARMQLTTLRQNFMTLQAFFTERKNDATIAIVKDGLSKIDALDKLLAAPAPDQQAAMAAAKEVQGTCGACHKMNREGDQQTGFRFRPGVF
jgi:cytochrome c556